MPERPAQSHTGGGEHRERHDHPRRVHAGVSDQCSTRAYATPIIRSFVHNFCSYLPSELADSPPANSNDPPVVEPDGTIYR